MKSLSISCCWLCCLMVMLQAACKEQLDRVEEIPPIQKEVELNMVGKWQVVSEDGFPILTDDKYVVTYQTGWKSYRSQSTMSLSKTWLSHSEFSCAVYGNTITEKLGNLTYVSDVVQITPQELQTVTSLKDGEKDKGFHRYVFRKVKQDYTSAIVGLWEGKFALPGIPDSTDHRWEFRKDGSFVYYNHDMTLNEWVVNPDKSAMYVLDGTWLALKRKDPKMGEVRECWDIMIENDQMYWIALRKDSVRGNYDDKMQLTLIK